MSTEDAILVEYDPFAMESSICIFKDGNREYSRVFSGLDSIAGDLVALAYENNIYTIYTHAPFAVSSEIRRQIAEQEQTTYATNKIIVEGI